MRKCECENELTYDGYEEMDFEDGYLVVKGNAECNECGKKYNYEDLYVVDFNKPFDVILEETE